jgi:hypothetical protein
LKERKSDHIHQPGNIDKLEKDDMQGMEVNNDTDAITHPQNRISGLHQLQKKENEEQTETEMSDDKSE